MDGDGGIAECPRCGRYVLRFKDAGLTIDVATKSIPVQDAAVLHRYGVMCYFVERRAEGGFRLCTFVRNTIPERGTIHTGHRCSTHYETTRG